MTGRSNVGFLIGLILAIFGRSLTSSKSSLGVVAVTETELVLIQLDGKSFDGSQVIEKISRDIVLPEPKSFKGGMLGDSLPFAKEGDSSWYYAALTDHGTGYIPLLRKLREISMQVRESGNYLVPC